MFKTILSLVLASLITMITSVPIAAQSQPDKVKAKVTKIGTGKKAGVDVKLNDNTRLKGYVGEIAANHFTVINSKHGTVTTVSYDQVQQIKSTERWVLPLVLGVGTIIGVILIVAVSLRGS